MLELNFDMINTKMIINLYLTFRFPILILRKMFSEGHIEKNTNRNIKIYESVSELSNIIKISKRFCSTFFNILLYELTDIIRKQ